MKRLLGIAVVLSLVGALTVMAQDADTAPSGVKKSTTPNDKMQRAWLWVKGTKFTGTTLVFASDKKIGIKPSKEKLHIYSKDYVSNWEPNGSARIDTAIHSIFQGPAPEDYSGVTFKFENLKVDGLEMTGTCSYEIIYGFKGDKQSKKLKEDKVPVKFISSGLITITSNQPNPNNAGQPGDPKIPEGPLTESEKFNQEVLKEIDEIFEKNPGEFSITLWEKADRMRKMNGDSPKWVAVEHYFFGRTLRPFADRDFVESLNQLTGDDMPLFPTFRAGVFLMFTRGYERVAPIVNLVRPINDRGSGQRGDFRENIALWGTYGLLGWRP